MPILGKPPSGLYHSGAMKVLFITATRIGDAVLSTGVLGHLIERHPDSRFTIAAGPAAAPLFDFIRAGARIGEVKAEADESRVEQLARSFALAPAPAPRLYLAARHERAAAALVPQGTPVLAIGPAANWRGKQWRAERFAELAARLTGPGGILPGARVAVLAAAHERAQAAPLLAAIPGDGLVDLVGKVDLLTASAVLRRAALFIGNDTGLMHVAAASGTPTVGLFGPTPAARYAPWGERTAVAQTEVPSLDLYGPDFDHRTTDTMMDSLTVDAAEAAARRLWRSIGGAAA